MISAKFWLDDTQEWGAAIVIDGYAKLPEVDYRFDESFDTAEFMCYTNDLPYALPLEAWTKCELTLDDKKFVGFVSGYRDEMIEFGNGHNGNRQATIELVELIAVTQYITLSNLNFTNDIVVSDPTTSGAVNVTVKTKKASAVVERLSRQIFNLHGQESPFTLQYDPTDWWVNAVMPEFRFSSCTLFDCLKDIGDAVGGFPYLEFIAGGVYELHFLQWDNQSTEHHTDNTVQSITRSVGIDNQGFVIDSTVENLLSVAPNGDNAVTFPAVDGFKAPVTQDYVTQITKDNCYFEVDRPIFQLLKIEAYSPDINTYIYNSSGPTARNTADVTNLFVEFDRWKTFKEEIEVLGVALGAGEAKNTRGYWTYNSNKIQGFQDMWRYFCLQYMTIIKGSALNDAEFLAALNQSTPLYINFKVTYIPTAPARVMAIQDGAKKPIGQPYNQGSNIIQAGSYASNIQGLANRIHGKQTTLQKQTKRGETLYQVGEWLNGEIITSARHEYSPTTVFSTYETSPNFNRRNPFIFFPHQQRQWAIPADGQVTDRQLLYIDEIQCSIGTPCEESDGALTPTALTQYLANYRAEQNKPCLAYLAWKKTEDIENDTDPKQSKNYALATITSVPFGRAILMHWQAQDNASMGSRTYQKYGISPLGKYLIQQFVQYDEKAEYLNVKISTEKPTSYYFDSNYTGSKAGSEDINQNMTLQRTFPLSNKKQWTDATYVAKFDNLRIEKDLSERILFNYLLQFVGKNDTIIYDNACTLNSLCNSKEAVWGFELWFSNETYSYWDTKAKGTGYYATASISYVDGNAKINLSSAYTGAYTSVAVTDLDGNLMFARNGAGNGGEINLYMSDRRKKWVKI